MAPVKSSSHLVVRLYAVWGALLVVLLLPAAIARIGVVRVQPVVFDGTPRENGQVMGTSTSDGRRDLWAEVSIAGGPWLPAGGVVVRRSLVYLPAGTPVAYRNAAGAEVRASVREAPAPSGRFATDATLALLALVLTVAGVGLAVSGVTRAALYAGASLVGLGHLSGAFLLEPNAALLSSAPARDAVVFAWSAFPRHLAFFWLASFLSLFPTDASARPVPRASRRLLALLACAQWGLVVLFHVPGTLDRLEFPLQAVLVGTVRLLTRVNFAAGLAAAFAIVVVQLRAFRKGTLPSGTRRRAELVGLGLLAGFGPPLLLALAQSLSVVLRGRMLIPSAVMAVSFLPILLVPVVLAYAMLAPRVLSVGILVRKAVFLAFADRTLRVASFVPLAALGVQLYRERESPVGAVLGEHPVLAGLAVVATFAGLKYGDRIRPALARLFFRARGASPRALAGLAEELRQARDLPELSDHLAGGVERVLGVEQAALFVRSEGPGGFSAPGRALPSLDASSAILEAAAARPAPFRIEPDEGDELWRDLTELDRNWVESTRMQLLVPLRGSGGHLLGVLAVGETLSELPLDGESEQFLAAAASAGALALENLLLRSSQASSGGAPPGARMPEAGDDPEAARLCRRCRRLFPADAGSACPDDEALFEPVSAPILLAGKYRLERWIGAGGMGVVYKARDLALARDVAVKTLPSLAAGSARRLQREARAAALLVHPNLGLIFSLESWRGTPMLVLEYLPGGTLSDRIRKGPAAPGLAAAWGAALASGLEAIHSRGVLHRDLKPSNVGFAADGTPKLLDFGLVRLLDDPEAPAATAVPPDGANGSRAAASATQTAASHVVGTVPYLSPEALQGRTPSPAFDLWGLSLTVYEALTGVNPFAASSNARTAERILSRAVPDPRTLRPGCPDALAALLLAALSRDARERPASARALREAFEEAGRGLPAASPGDAAPRPDVDPDACAAPTVER